MLARLNYQGIPIWRHVQVIQWISQALSGVLVIVLVSWFFINIANAIQEREIPYGFSFLSRAYHTPIGQHILPYESSDTFLYALGVAAVNTLAVAISGVILATALGIVIGVGRLSSNWIVARMATIYIGFFRNVPLLVQLFFWFYLVLALPEFGRDTSSPTSCSSTTPGYPCRGRRLPMAGPRLPGPSWRSWRQSPGSWFTTGWTAGKRKPGPLRIRYYPGWGLPWPSAPSAG